MRLLSSFPLRITSRKACLCILLLQGIAAGNAGGQALIPPAQDSLFAAYLAHPEARAAQKIRALTDKAVALGNTPAEQEQAIGLFQIGLAIAPYAADSPAAVARLYAQLSGRMQQARALNLAIRYCKDALALHRKAAGGLPSAEAYNMLGNIAGYYFTENQFDSAKHYFGLAKREARRYGETLWIASSYNNMGFLLAHRGDYTAASAQLDTAMQYTVSIARMEGRKLICAIVDNQAGIALEQGRMDEAAALYRDNISLADSLLQGLELSHRVWKSELGLARASGAQAATALAEAHAIMDHNPYWFNAADSVQQFQAEEDYYLDSGRWQASCDASRAKDQLKQRLSDEQRDQLNNIFEALTFSRIYQFETAIRQYRADIVQEQRRGQLYLLIGLLSAAVLLTLYAASRLRYKARHQLQQEALRARAAEQELAQVTIQNQNLLQEKTDRELQYKKKDLADLSTYVGRLKSLYEGMVEKLGELRSQPSRDQQQGLQRLVNEVNAQLQSQERMMAIQENAGAINAAFNQRILGLFPDLSRSELELCGFISLGMSNKEVAVIKAISQDSAKMARYRLRKKLGLKPEEDIYAFIAGL